MGASPGTCTPECRVQGLLAFHFFDHVADGTIDADHDGLAYDAVADDDFVDTFNGSDGAYVTVVEPTASLDL